VNDISTVVGTDVSLATLRRDGIAYVPWSMGAAELAEMKAFLDECLVWPAHVSTKADQTFRKKLKDARKSKDWPVYSPTMEDVVRAPHWLEYAMRCFPLAKEYFGEFPRLYSVNVFWSQPANYPYGETHDWHRDGDDRKQFGMFLFGTDVTEEDGPHLYQRGTHRHSDGRERAMKDVNAEHLALDAELGAQKENPRPEDVIKITGPAGTMFFEDPNGVHRGLRPKKPRMFAWARWGVSNPTGSYLWDKLRPCSKDLIGDRYPYNDPEMQEAIRLVVS
jgi:Phytanoyl-CoA dioxygenase (PhyH)